MKKILLVMAVMLMANVGGFSQTVIKQGLDSVVNPRYKDVFSYDSIGNKIMITRIYTYIHFYNTHKLLASG